MAMSTNRLLTVPLKLLKRTGMDPRDKDISKIQRFIFILMNVMLYIDFVLICLFDWKGFDSVAEITIYISFMHVGYKLFSLMAKQEHYVAVFQTISKFTKWKRLQGQIKEDVDDTVKLFSNVMHAYQIVVIATILGYCLSPLLISSKRLTPLETHFLKYYDNTVIYVIAYVYHTFVFFLSVLCILGHESLYVFVITTINIEIRIIKHRIQNILVGDADQDSIDEMSQIVDQHNLILKAIKQCNTVYSDVTLIQFLTSIIFLSTSMFAIMDNGFPPQMGTVLTFGLHLSASMFQLFIYCTVGQLLINETQSISDAIYNIKWWAKPQPKLRQACVLMIQRANKVDYLIAAGMFIVNYESFTEVLKFGFSLFSLTNVMRARDE